jgi:hypothetical protein
LFTVPQEKYPKRAETHRIGRGHIGAYLWNWQESGVVQVDDMTIKARVPRDEIWRLQYCRVSVSGANPTLIVLAIDHSVSKLQAATGGISSGWEDLQVTSSLLLWAGAGVLNEIFAPADLNVDTDIGAGSTLRLAAGPFAGPPGGPVTVDWMVHLERAPVPRTPGMRHDYNEDVAWRKDLAESVAKR